MGKHAYLIMVHNNYKVLEKTLLLLDAPYHEIYIHVDSKVKDFPQLHFENLLKFSNVHIYSKINVNWGGYSQVECEMYLLKEAFSVNNSFYHLISGSDMPLRRKEEIYDFFEQHIDLLFLTFYDSISGRKKQQLNNRLTKFHLLQEFRKRSNKETYQKIMTFLSRLLIGLQIVCRVNRIGTTEVFYGSQWFSLPYSFVKYLLEQQDNIRIKYRYTQCPDEHFIQMYAMSSEFCHKLYRNDKNEYDNMRYIEFNTELSAHPMTFQTGDIDKLLNSTKYFARKFDENVDFNVVEELYTKLKD